MSLAPYVAAGAGLGACLRYVVDLRVQARLPDRDGRPAFPLGTLVVNLTGTLALGVLVGLRARGSVGDGPLAVLGTGLLGGYTTFSTFAWETVRLVMDGVPRRAALNLAASLGLGLLVAVSAFAVTLA